MMDNKKSNNIKEHMERQQKRLKVYRDLLNKLRYRLFWAG